MSSEPFKIGLPIIDKLRYGYPDEFILRAKSREDAEKKIRDLVTREPIGADIRVWHFGFRPDKPVPVAMYFCEIIIKGNDNGKRGRFV